METELFYIFLQNRYYRHENSNDDFHLEKIFTKNEIEQIINEETKHNVSVHDLLIITDDIELLSKYIFCINEEEMKMLCGSKIFNSKEIRIHKNYFPSFSDELLDYFNKIKTDEIVSANMSLTYSTVYPYDDTSIGIDSLDYNGWVTNKEFNYFKIPSRYRKNNESEVFNLTDVTKADIETFKKLININILEIGNHENPNINWELRNGLLRYYDRVSSQRLYISQKLLNLLIEDNSLEFNIETRLDKNHYIEYYVTGIFEEYDDDFESQNYEREDSSISYEKYNGAYGFDDDTIDSAFESDPENYWNID